jgi:cysteine sulfinate desulfinase/cysteine desulfurase-like protein
MGLSNAEADSSIRFSFGRFTTGDEVEEAARLIIHSLESVQESFEPSPIVRS